MNLKPENHPHMEKKRKRILLTGATGFIGRYLFRNFLQQGYDLTVLLREKQGESISMRIRKLLQFADNPSPVKSDVRIINCNLNDLQVNQDLINAVSDCDMIVHSAASLHFQLRPDGDPWVTNVEGTKNLISLAKRSGIRRWIQISTAYVCGQQKGVIKENNRFPSPPNNDYESSKREAENIIRSDDDLEWTILRPGIVVGDRSRGYTSNYQGIYHCFQSVAIMSRNIKAAKDGRKELSLRFPLTGEEKTHLVPVDWIADAIVQLSMIPGTAGHSIHLTQAPVTARQLVENVQDYFTLHGMRFIGKNGPELTDKNIFERIFDRDTKRLGPYFQDDPDFETVHLKKFLPDFESSPIDRKFIHQLLSFAETDNWGKTGNESKTDLPEISCPDFFENYLVSAVSSSRIKKIKNLNLQILFQVTGNQGGNWVCQIQNGDVQSVHRVNIPPDSVQVSYRADHCVFIEIITGMISTRDAFFEQKIQITGDIEKALLLSVMLEDILQEIPYKSSHPKRESICA